MLDNFLEAIKTESKTCPQRPRVYKLDLKPQECSVLKCIWESWHTEVGLAVREKFEKMVEFSNRAARENGERLILSIDLRYTQLLTQPPTHLLTHRSLTLSRSSFLSMAIGIHKGTRLR